MGKKHQQSATFVDDKDCQTGQVLAHRGDSVELETADGDLKVCRIRRQCPQLVCGDFVKWQPDSDEHGIVVSLVERSSLLTKTAQSKKKQTAVIPYAANVSQLFIVNAIEPALSLMTLDRYLVSAELNDIIPVIVINKKDLLTSTQLEDYKSHLNVYDDIGYQVVFTSALSREASNDLQSCLANNTSIFVGQSGVGKSSIIKQILPEEDIKVGALAQSQLGAHTTSVTRLHRLSNDAALIDSPGIRELGLAHIDATDIIYGFREFRPYIGQCKYRNCQHQNDPGCAIVKAVEDGKISESRYQNYLTILKDGQ